jgi:hypothetical protein
LAIERNTRGQGKNPEWRSERKERLTASNFGRYLFVMFILYLHLYFRVAKIRSTKFCQNMVTSILYPNRVDNMEATK